MKAFALALADVLLLAACGDAEEPDGESPTGQASTDEVAETDLTIDPAAVCDRLLDLPVMPHSEEIAYVDVGGGEGNAVRCSIEPSDWGAAAALGQVGQEVMQLQILDEGTLELQPGEMYERGRPAGEYQIEEFDEVVHGDPEEWPDSIGNDGAATFTGHRYEYWFEAKLPGSWVRHEILFLVPGSDGTKSDKYRLMAEEIFTAYMDALPVELE